jgi:chemotaxis protein methyltransferase CheR
MNPTLPDDLLSRFSGWVAEQMGLHFGPERRSDLQRGLEATGRELGLGDAGACLQRLLAGPVSRQQFDVLACHLTVGETYFFRDQRGLEILETEILPGLVQSRRRGERCLRLWSAGCATGEEAYSLAILLTRMLPDWSDWAITVLGTDINPQALEHAQQGVYGEWSFRDEPPWLKDRFFQPVAPGRYRLIPQIRRMVTFAALNLARDPYPSLLNSTNAMDVIVCRNVVMYFSPEQARQVLARLRLCLVEGGWLLGSPTEGSYLTESGLTAVSFPGATLFRRVAMPRVREEKLPAGDVLADAVRAWEECRSSHPKVPGDSGDRRSTGWLGQETGHSAAPDRRSTGWLGQETGHSSAPPCAGPDPLVAVFEQALEDHCRGRNAEAAAALERLATEAPQRAEVFDLLTRVYADQGHLSAALNWSDRAITADKMNSQHHYLRATILLELGQGEQAAASLQRALYLDPDFVLAHFALGSLARRLGQEASARRHLANALDLLAACPPDSIVPASEGVTAGRLREIIAAMAAQEAVA